MSYDELEYWNRRACPNATNGGDISDVINYFWERIPYSGNVLDFGAGIGRMFPAYRDANEVVAVELSKIYTTRLMEASRHYAFDFSVILTNSVMVPEFLCKFDVAVASMVLLHQRPENLGRIMHGLAMSADKVCVLTWATDRHIPDLADHCFNHNYKTELDYFGFNVLDWKQEDERLLFTYALP